MYERAEEFETKTRDLETQLREMESKVKETETITVKNADEEEKFENKITKLQDEFKQADTRSVLTKIYLTKLFNNMFVIPILSKNRIF